MSIHNRVSVTFGLLRPCLLTVVVLSTFLSHQWMPASAGETVSEPAASRSVACLFDAEEERTHA